MPPFLTQQLGRMPSSRQACKGTLDSHSDDLGLNFLFKVLLFLMNSVSCRCQGSVMLPSSAPLQTPLEMFEGRL